MNSKGLIIKRWWELCEWKLLPNRIRKWLIRKNAERLKFLNTLASRSFNEDLNENLNKSQWKSKGHQNSEIVLSNSSVQVVWRERSGYQLLAHLLFAIEDLNVWSSTLKVIRDLKKWVPERWFRWPRLGGNHEACLPDSRVDHWGAVMAHEQAASPGDYSG